MATQNFNFAVIFFPKGIFQPQTNRNYPTKDFPTAQNLGRGLLLPLVLCFFATTPRSAKNQGAENSEIETLMSKASKEKELK